WYTIAATQSPGSAKPCWLGSDFTLLMSLTVTFVPFFTTSVPGDQIFVPSYSMLTTVKVMAAGSAAGARPASATRQAIPASVPTSVRMRALLGWVVVPLATTLAATAQR